jgi:hypothetical protein
MLLSVPITVSLMIITASFKKTRPIAIILSQNGQLEVIEKMIEATQSEPILGDEASKADTTPDADSPMKKVS